MPAVKSLRRRALAVLIVAGLTSQSVALADNSFASLLAENRSQEDAQIQQVVLQEALANDVVSETAIADPQVTPEPETEAHEAEAAQAVVAEQQVAPAYQPTPQAFEAAVASPMANAAPCKCCNSTCCTKKKKEAATNAMKSAYGGVFYANKFGYMNDPCYNGPSFLGESLKGLCDNKLDIGGEARVRYHNENNFRGRAPGLRGPNPSGLGLTNNDDDFFLTRVRLYADFQVTENLRVYGEYLYADSGGETFNNRPIEENRGEMQNLFLDAKLTDNLTARVGRQELIYGAQRLISPLDWANTRRTFEGARGLYKGDDWSFDGFFVHPVKRNAAFESKIDDADENQDFYGFYATRKGMNIGSVDMYYLGYDNQTADFNYHTIGSRVSGKTDGGLLYETEGGFQFGDNAPGLGSHSANFFTAGLGRQLTICDWKPTVWMWYDTASGEENFANVGRGDDGFDHLNPLAHKYLGFMDLFGRRNIQDFNMQFITPVLGKKVKMLLWYHYLRLNEQTTPYDVVMQPYNTNTAAGSKELGHEIDCLFTIALNPRNNVLLGYSHFSAGDYYDTTAGVPNNDADFFYAQFQTRF